MKWAAHLPPSSNAAAAAEIAAVQQMLSLRVGGLDAAAYLMLPLRPLGKNRPLPVLEPAVTMEITCVPDSKSRVNTRVQSIPQCQDRPERQLAGS